MLFKHRFSGLVLGKDLPGLGISSSPVVLVLGKHLMERLSAKGSLVMAEGRAQRAVTMRQAWGKFWRGPITCWGNLYLQLARSWKGEESGSPSRDPDNKESLSAI